MLKSLRVTLLVFIVGFSVNSFAGDGVISSVKGKAFSKKPEKKERRARRGQRLQPGDAIKTEAGGYVKVTMSDKNIFHVGPDTEVILKSYQLEGEQEEGQKPLAQLEVLYGKVRTVIDEDFKAKGHRFEVNTRAAVLGVRGTDFLTEHSEVAEQTRATAFSGVVNITGVDEQGNSVGSIDLTAGQMTLINFGGTPLEPLDLPDSILETINSGSLGATGSRSLKPEAIARLESDVPDINVTLAELPVIEPKAEPEEFVDRNVISSGASGANTTVNLELLDGT